MDPKKIDFVKISKKNKRINNIVRIQNSLLTRFDLFEQAITQTEIEFKEKLNITHKELLSFREQLKVLQEKNQSDSDEFYTIFEQENEKFIEEQSISDYLNIFAETKITYMFKSMEIDIKSLLKTAYPGVDIKNFHIWKIVKEFLLNQGIVLSKIKGYEDFDELRILNNCIKHSDSISDDVRNIKEFRNIEVLDAISINSFYERVKVSADEFFRNLVNAVVDNIYEFDDNRIESISKVYSERMDKKVLSKFIDSLKNKLDELLK